MKPVWLAAFAILLLVTAACNGGEPEPTPDIDATVEARVQATQEAEASIDATVAARVPGDPGSGSINRCDRTGASRRDADHAVPYFYALAHGNTTAHANTATHGNTTAHANTATHGNTTAHANTATHGNTTAHANTATHGNTTAHANSGAYATAHLPAQSRNFQSACDDAGLFVKLHG